MILPHAVAATLRFCYAAMMPPLMRHAAFDDATLYAAPMPVTLLIRQIPPPARYAAAIFFSPLCRCRFDAAAPRQRCRRRCHGQIMAIFAADAAVAFRRAADAPLMPASYADTPDTPCRLIIIMIIFAA